MDLVLADPAIELPSLLKDILIHTLAYYRSATNDNDRNDYTELFHNVFRLLTVLTYDTRTCEILANSDIQYASKVVKEKKKAKKQMRESNSRSF